MPDIADTNLPAKDVIRHLTHELRQPLSALESIAFYLQMTAGGDRSDISAHIDRIQQMVDNANWVLSDMLHLLQMAPPNAEPIILEEIVEEVLAESWTSEGISWETAFPGELPAIAADLEQFRHLLRSVCHFLCHNVGQPRAVTIAARSAANAVHLEFRAYAPAVVPASVFHPLEANQLLTCRRIAENNRGQFVAETDADGGLLLRLDLPAAV